MTPTDEIWQLRRTLWQNGYRPLAIRNSLKFPIDDGWQLLARDNPPQAVRLMPHPHCFNTGILCDGLRPIDIDLPNQADVHAVAEWCLSNLGPAPIRYRQDSPRALLLYQATEGEPRKDKVWNADLKIGVEVLGRGNQFLAFGRHPDGAQLEWLDDTSPLTCPRQHLSAFDTEALEALLAYAGQFVPEPEVHRSHAYAIGQATQPAEWCIADIRAALQVIPNGDYEKWYRVGMAVYSASGGSAEGYALFRDWSAQISNHKDRDCEKLWQTDPDYITGGTLRHYAIEADSNWMQPSRRLAILPLFHKR